MSVKKKILLKKVQDVICFGKKDVQKTINCASAMVLNGRIVKNVIVGVIRRKMDVLKSKKSQVFSLVFVFALIGMLVAAYMGFNNKYSSFEVELGSRQLDLLNIYYKSESNLFCSDQSAKYSIYQSIYDLGQNGGFFNEPECGKYDNFILWSGKNKECFPDSKIIRNSISNFLKKYNAEYLNLCFPSSKAANKDNYDFVFEEIEEIYEKIGEDWIKINEKEC